MPIQTISISYAHLQMIYLPYSLCFNTANYPTIGGTICGLAWVLEEVNHDGNSSTLICFFQNGQLELQQWLLVIAVWFTTGQS
jgi:hypothetical protein